jgi:hypothetical protein
MRADGHTPSTPAARNLEAGALLIGLGAILLFVSLFLEWYQPGVEAWDVFEVWDLVLAALAVAALVAVASRMGYGPPRPASWVLAPAIAALVIVVYAFLDPPPATTGLPDGDPGTGLWLALVAVVLMTAGAVLSVARISVAITSAPSAFGGTPAAHGDPMGMPATAAPATTPTGAPGLGGRFVRREEPVVTDPGAPLPTEPTRRL